MKPERSESSKAKVNFEQAMKKVFQVSKSEIKEAEEKDKAKRKQKKN